MKKPRIVIVNSSSYGNVFPEHLAALESFAEVDRLTVPIDIPEAEFLAKLQGYNGILASVNPNYPASLLQQLNDLVIITRHGIGYNNVDVKAALELGIPVTKVDGPIERISVAEQTIALLFSVARRIPPADIAVRESRWSDRAQFIGVEVCKKKIGVIGLGNIGSKVSEILAGGFEADVLGVDPALTDDQIRSFGARPASLEEIISTADIIALQCSLNTENYHLLSTDEFARMKDGVIIVNTARGELIDDQAMLAALDSGKVWAYGADVVEGEPIDGSHPLLKSPRATVVPHLGGYSYESLRGMGETMVNDMRAVFVENRMPSEHLVIPEMAAKGLRPWA